MKEHRKKIILKEVQLKDVIWTSNHISPTAHLKKLLQEDWTSTCANYRALISNPTTKASQLKIQIPERQHWDWCGRAWNPSNWSQGKITANPSSSSIREIERRCLFRSRVSLLIVFSADIWKGIRRSFELELDNHKREKKIKIMESKSMQKLREELT